MKILMTLMGLEIGGAETHVIELCKELAARGVNLTVASNGGVYVAELEKAGIPHVRLPLHTKTPASMARALAGLRALIEREKFDIVHAHARIPGFLCGLLAAGPLKTRHRFRFITTTHGVFKVGPILTRMTNWGDYSVAVSHDIKQYLIDNYAIPADRIAVTINGIDTARFSAATDASAVKAELGLADGKFRVIYVSRIDTEAALPGFLLCDGAAELAARIPELEILIVGGGTAFEELKARARAVNAAIGREVIRLTGARTDVANLIAASDVFVGVSRAALEAMSEEKPVVLAGAQGYIGVLTPENTDLARSTNFCCRGCRLPEAQDLVGDLLHLYEMDNAARNEMGAAARNEMGDTARREMGAAARNEMGDTARREMGRYNRSLVLAGYSVARMCDDYMAVWESLPPMEKGPSELLISGYYGFGNMGDDSLLAALIRGIRAKRPETVITVLSGNPKETAKKFGVRAINRYHLPAIRRAMKKAKVLVSGGGSLLQDGTSRKSLFYYLTIMRMAKSCQRKLMITANGLGPLESKSGRKRTAEIMNRADFISLREEHSLALARAIGVKAPTRISADPAFLLPPCDEAWADYVRAREGIARDCFIVSVKGGRDAAGIPADDIRAIAKKHGLQPLFVPMHPDRDTAPTEALAAAVGCGRILKNLTAGELCGLMSRCQLVIGTRLHMLIFAASMGVPMLGIRYDPKIDAFMDYIGQGSRVFDQKSLEAGILASAADELLGDADAVRAALRSRADALRALAAGDCQAIAATLASL